MTMYGRNDRNVFAALSSEEERRRANEEAAKRPRPEFEEVEGAGTGCDLRPGLTSRILGAIRRAFVR
jgi:hypothetical protein